MTTTSLWLFLRKKNYSPHYQIQITTNQNRIPTHPAGESFRHTFQWRFRWMQSIRRGGEREKGEVGRGAPYHRATFFDVVSTNDPIRYQQTRLI